MLQIFTKKHRGFTLIELLVVIAIIGILATIVLVSLTGARGRARDARIIAAMGQIRTQAVIYESLRGGTYSGMSCATSTSAEMPSLCDDIDIQCRTGVGDCNNDGAIGNDAAGGAEDIIIRATSTEYCVVSGLNSGGWFCIDEGRAIEISPGGTNPTAVHCTLTRWDCP